MKNSIARQILEETPAETRQFVRHYGDLVVRIHDILEAKGWTQKDLAEKLHKSPSEISKWLSGEHNFTLRSLAKLEVELGEDLIKIPKTPKAKQKRVAMENPKKNAKASDSTLPSKALAR